MFYWVNRLILLSFFFGGGELWAADQKKVWHTHYNGDAREIPLDEIAYSPAQHSFQPPEAFIWMISMGYDGHPVAGYQVPLYREVDGALESIPNEFLTSETEFFPRTIHSVNGGLFYGGDFAGAEAIRRKNKYQLTEPIWVDGYNLKVTRKKN